MLAYGINHYKIFITKSVHAEKAAIDKLKSTRKWIWIDVYVLRVDRNGKLCYSKPCQSCIEYMRNNLPKRRYRIHKLFYSINETEYAKL